MKNIPKLRSILYIDDDSQRQAIVSVILISMANLEVRVCGSAREALIIAATNKPDLVLFDVTTWSKNAATALHSLCTQACTRDTPVIIMTNGAKSRDARYFKLLGAAGMIATGFEPLMLAETVLQSWEAIEYEFLAMPIRRNAHGGN
jgi:CheY-like chemotaxis protein